MRRLFAPGVFLLCSLGWTAAHAQTLPYNHVHLAIADPVKAVEWYIKHHRTPSRPRGRIDLSGDTLVIFQKADARQPSAGGAVDHVGFSFANLDAKMAELERDGVRILAPARELPGVFKLGFIEDPWGVKIEVMQDPDARGFSHIHLLATNPDETLTWYAGMFGGERVKFKGSIDAVKFGSVWLLALKGEPATGERRAIDHLSWRVANVDEATARLKAKGVQVLTDPGPSPGGNRVSFVEGPAAVRIEIMQRPQ